MYDIEERFMGHIYCIIYIGDLPFQFEVFPCFTLPATILT